MYGLGVGLGGLGAGFKGALAFAGTVVVGSLIVTGTLTALASPPGWVLAFAIVIGVATWVVQCSRACPNTGNSLAKWSRKSGYGAENSPPVGRRSSVVRPEPAVLVPEGRTGTSHLGQEFPVQEPQIFSSTTQ